MMLLNIRVGEILYLCMIALFFIFPSSPLLSWILHNNKVLHVNVCYGVKFSHAFQFYSIRYVNNRLCISMDSNAFSRSIAEHIALFLSVDHINWSVAY